MADEFSSKAIYDSKTKTLSLEGVLVPFIDEFTGKETDNKGIFDAQLQEKTKLVFELIPWSINLKNMFDGDDASGYILYDYKTRSVKIPCFQVTTIAQFGDGIEGAYNEVPATSLLIKEGERRNVLITEANCWTKQTFRDFIASLTWNAEGSDQNWADNSGAYHCDYTDFGYNDPVLRASIQTNKKLLFKWGEKDGVQDQNKDRTMITTPNANNSNAHVDLPTGLGGFTSYGVNMNYKDANECQADGPDQCSSHTEQNYQLFIR